MWTGRRRRNGPWGRGGGVFGGNVRVCGRARGAGLVVVAEEEVGVDEVAHHARADLRGGARLQVRRRRELVPRQAQLLARLPRRRAASRRRRGGRRQL